MSISKKWLSQPNNIQAALKLYRSLDCPTIAEIAEKLGTTSQTIQWVCKNHLSQAEHKALSSIRYSRSKQGEKNPMHGKTGEQHHNWIGLVDDGHGYLTCIKDGKRQLVHRVVMAEALGLRELPDVFEVHHINQEDKKNNDLDNLALTTGNGHKRIHYLQVKDSLSVSLKKSTLRDALKFMTSR